MDKIGFKSDVVSKLLGKANEPQVKPPPGAVKVMGTGVSEYFCVHVQVDRESRTQIDIMS